jgi:hypothetical protein
MSEKVTPEQLRDDMLRTFLRLADYWATIPEYDEITDTNLTVRDRCHGVVFSILSQLDGVGSLPSFDLVSHVHPDDEDQSCEGVVISDMLHEHWGKLAI